MALLSAIGAAALVYAGIMGRGLSTGHPEPDIAVAVVMFSVAALCLAMLRRAVIQLRSGSLRLDEIGFELAGCRRERYLWREVGDFRPALGRGSVPVGFRVGPPKNDADALLNLRFLGGRDVWLPDNYAYRSEELAQLMADWQTRAIEH
ncbi:hypothetical protein [Rhodoplanes sp. Z2-YC6860]|uniref:hypothetical protein n=1 Tax=Rhodoplanes sp. Z2-YC6860 TaxID=674703 RepID=UPI0012EDB9FD|nr:hypothetical protein [Rhodoplanes sp. Z2-YC6860]